MATRHTKKLKTFMDMAYNMATLATCRRRSVGCILLDSNYKIIGAGYNGNGKGMEHCIDKPCPGADLASGQGLSICEAIHAEQNALMQCSNIDKIYYCVTTTYPCSHCLKMLLNTNCQYIVYSQEYNTMPGVWTRNVYKV